MLLVRLPVNTRLLVTLGGSQKSNLISDHAGGGAGTPDPTVFKGQLCCAIYRRDSSVLESWYPGRVPEPVPCGPRGPTVCVCFRSLSRVASGK